MAEKAIELIKYLPEVFGYFQGKKNIKNEVERLRNQEPIKQDRLQMDAALQNLNRAGNTTQTSVAQEGLERGVQQALANNPRNVNQLLDKLATGSAKISESDTRQRNAINAQAMRGNQMLDARNSAIDRSNLIQDRMQEERVAGAEAAKNRLNMRGLSTLGSILGDSVGFFDGIGGMKAVRDKTGTQNLADEPKVMTAEERAAAVEGILPEDNSIKIDQNVERALNRQTVGSSALAPSVRILEQDQQAPNRVTYSGDLQSPERMSSIDPSRIDNKSVLQALTESATTPIAKQKLSDFLGYNGPQAQAEARDSSFPKFDPSNLKEDESFTESVSDLSPEELGDLMQYARNNPNLRTLAPFEEEDEPLSEEDFPLYGSGNNSGYPNIANRFRGGRTPLIDAANNPLNRFSPNYDPFDRVAYDGRDIIEDPSYFENIRRGSEETLSQGKLKNLLDALTRDFKEGGAVVTPEGYDHDGVDIDMRDAQTGKMVGKVESAEMIVNSADTEKGIRLAKNDPNNPLSKWYLSLTKKFREQAKNRK